MRQNKFTWILLAALSCLCIAGNMAMAAPVAWQQAEQSWLSQQTAHFSIHFLDGHQKNAARALDIAEQVHQELLPFFKSAPQQRTEIVLVDDYDFSNGWATAQPFAQIRLIMSPPDGVNKMENYDEWLHLLIRHEYTHILHMELAGGAVDGLRHVFGRNLFLFPHMLTPSVLLEGLAVYLETNNDLGYGRLQGSSYAMQMRMQVAGNELKDLQQVSVASREWPLGSPYLYGAYFIEYLSDTYGVDKVQLFLHNYSRKLLPYFLLNHSAKKAFGKDFFMLWRDYQHYLTTRFSGQITTHKNAAVTGNDLDKNLFMRVTTSSKVGLLVNLNNGEDRPFIAQLNLDSSNNSQWQKIVNSKKVNALSSHATAGLAVSRQINYADGRVFNDLFLYQKGDWIRLTERQRFRKVRWLANGKQLLASRNVDGRSELWLIDAQPNGAQQQIWQGEQGMVVGEFDVSPKGDYLVASLKRPLQGWNLERLSLNASDRNYLKWQALTDTKAAESSPLILADERVLFSADYQGIYNIFVLDQNSQKVTQWTREVGGAFAPQWQDELGLVYQAYTSDGYILRHILQPKSLDVFPVARNQGRYDYPNMVQQKAQKSVQKAYSPWSTLRPRTWFPLLYSDELRTEVGVSFYGADALGRHNYQVAFDWDFKNSLANYNLNYQYDNRWFISAQRTHSFATLTENGEQDYRITEDDQFTVQRHNMFTLWEDNIRFHAGIVLDKERLVSQPDFSNLVQYRSSNETLSGLAMTFDNREYYLNVPGTGWGNYLDLIVESNQLFDSDYRGEKYQAQWLGTLDLTGRVTLTARLSFGYADSGAKAFKLGGHDLSDETRLFARDSQALRGYDEAVQWGDRYATQRLQLNGFLARVERNWGLFPIGLGDISGAVFVDSGASWNKGQDVNQLTGIGAELIAELKLGYGMTLPVTFGLAQGLDGEEGQLKGYLRMQLGF